MTLPNFLIVGAAKSGTSALANFLGQHPQVNMPYKEPNFFSGWDKQVHFDGPVDDYSTNRNFRRICSLTEYEALYADRDNKCVHVDASISYLADNQAAQNIFKSIPDAKLLIILRQPVDRAYSHFIMNIREGREKETNFLRFIDDEPNRIRNNWHPFRRYMEISHYPPQLVRYLDLFPSGQLKINLYEDWNEHPQVFWDELMVFLEIDRGFCPDLAERINISYIKTARLGIINRLKPVFKWMVPQHLRKPIRRWVEPMLWKVPKLNADLRCELTEKYFIKDILQLQELLGRDLSHWLF